MRMTSAGTPSPTPHGSTYTTGPSPCHRNAACRNHVTPSSPIAGLLRSGSLPVVLQIDVAVREPIETQGGLGSSVSLLRRNRNFRHLYLASVISLGGDWFLLIALFGLMLDLTGQAIAVAFTIAAQELTYFLASPFAGVLE